MINCSLINFFHFTTVAVNTTMLIIATKDAIRGNSVNIFSPNKTIVTSLIVGDSMPVSFHITNDIRKVEIVKTMVIILIKLLFTNNVDRIPMPKKKLK